MFYDFPEINNIKQVMEAIQGKDEFVVKIDEKNGYQIVNYVVSTRDTFPEIKDINDAILRECRGITFSLDGSVISRKYHKFFNLGERTETNFNKINLNIKHWFMEKLDGSMLTPIILSNGDIRWCTKMGLTAVAEPVDLFVKNSDIPYNSFICDQVSIYNRTPIFEWCSKKQRIIIDYPEDKLILTAIRDNITGKYVYNPDELKELGNFYNIPVVNSVAGGNLTINEIQDYIRNLKDSEGIVIRFVNGHMVKVKSDWYVNLHRTMEKLLFEKDIIKLILDEKLDDVKPVIDDKLIKNLDDFSNSIFSYIISLSEKLWKISYTSYKNLNGNKKRFALEVVHPDLFNRNHSKFLFNSFDNITEDSSLLYNHLIEYIKNNLTSQTKVDQIRYLIGNNKWDDWK